MDLPYFTVPFIDNSNNSINYELSTCSCYKLIYLDLPINCLCTLDIVASLSQCTKMVGTSCGHDSKAKASFSVILLLLRFHQNNNFKLYCGMRIRDCFLRDHKITHLPMMKLIQTLLYCHNTVFQLASVYPSKTAGKLLCNNPTSIVFFKCPQLW